MSQTTPVDIVQRQLEAYNSRDLERFLEQFADDAAVFDLGAPAAVLTGKAQIRDRYRDLFARSPHLFSRVVNRTAFAHVVVDLEHITGRNGSDEPFEVLAIYEVGALTIQRVHFVRKPS